MFHKQTVNLATKKMTLFFKWKPFKDWMTTLWLTKGTYIRFFNLIYSTKKRVLLFENKPQWAMFVGTVYFDPNLVISIVSFKREKMHTHETSFFLESLTVFKAFLQSQCFDKEAEDGIVLIWNVKVQLTQCKWTLNKSDLYSKIGFIPSLVRIS